MNIPASCVRNNRTKNYQNLITGFQVAVENVGDAFLGQCRYHNAARIYYFHCFFVWKIKQNK